MFLRIGLVFIFVVALMSSAGSASGQAGSKGSDSKGEGKVVINKKVSGLFEQFRNGEYRGVTFPELTWDDVLR